MSHLHPQLFQNLGWDILKNAPIDSAPPPALKVTEHSGENLHSALSPLIECPCSDRISRPGPPFYSRKWLPSNHLQ